jgi:integrase
MNEAVRERLITVSPFSRISWVPVVEHREMRFLTALEQAKLYSLNNEWTAAWQVLLATGMRSGEAFALSWKQVDLDAGRISIIQSISPKKDGYELVSPKTPQSRRTLQIAPAVVQVLRGVKERQEAEAKRLGDYWANPEQFVFTRGSGQAILPHYAYHQFMSALKEANLEHCRVHDLRHSFAADQINNGTPVLAVSRMLGHSTVAFTLQVYGHITTETQDTAASLSGRLLEEAMRTGQAMAEVVGGDRAQHDSSAVVV